jgi:hypothetical protein
VQPIFDAPMRANDLVELRDALQKEVAEGLRKQLREERKELREELQRELREERKVFPYVPRELREGKERREELQREPREEELVPGAHGSGDWSQLLTGMRYRSGQ